MRSVKRVLCVEDDSNLQEILQVILMNAGYEVECAGDGRVALAKIEAFRPDLVTLDLVLPEISGLGVLEALRSHPAPPIVILVTGSAGVARDYAALPSFVVGTLVKPFRITDFLTVCDLALVSPLGTYREAERRTVPRRMLIMDVIVLGPTGVPLFVAKLTKLSRRGAELLLETAVGAGSLIRFRLPHIGKLGPLEVEGTVLYQRDGRTGLLHGLAFSPDAATSNLVAEYLG